MPSYIDALTETSNDGVYLHRGFLPGSVEVVADNALP
jgi:hypothetical protein